MWGERKTSSVSESDPKSWRLIEKTLLASVHEQRRSRRWGIFFKLLTFIYLFGALALFSPLISTQGGSSSPHLSLIHI